MPAKKQSSSPDAIKAAYAAIVAYHNNLVQARFTITQGNRISTFEDSQQVVIIPACL